MEKKFVVVDLETTGHSIKSGDEMIEIGMAVIEDGQMTERLSAFVRPQKPIPPFISQLTGITDKDVADAETFDQIAPRVLQLLDGGVFVAHNVQFDLTFLNEALEEEGYLPYTGPVIDTVELARILLPTAESHSLSHLTDALHLTHHEAHRAGSDAEATAELLLYLLSELRNLPLDTLRHLRRLAGKLFSAIEEEIDQAIRLVGLEPDERFDSFRKIALKKRVDSEELTIRTDLEPFSPFVDRLNETVFPQLFPGYEPRMGQLEMMRHVYQSLDQETPLLVEAGTGTGKSLGYLVPAAHYAIEHETPIIVSTHTIQLQEQLFARDLPLLRQLFNEPVDITLLKGRNNYMDLRKFEFFLSETEEPYNFTLAKAILLVWLTQTDTGDLEEVSLPGGAAQGNIAIKQLIQSDSQSQLGRFDPWYSRDFFHHAVRRAKQATIIVTNHALLFSDIQYEAGVLPKGCPLILDEAHQIEEVASHHFGLVFDGHSFDRIFRQLGFSSDKKLLTKLISLSDQFDLTELVEAHSETIDETLTELLEEADGLLTIIQAYGLELASRKERREGRVTVRFKRLDHSMRAVQESAKRVELVLRRLRQAIRAIHKLFHDQREHMSYRERSVVADLKTVIGQLEEAEQAIFETMLAPHDETVSWIETTAKNRKLTRIYTQPIDISGRLHRDVFSKRTCVLTSATLTVSNKFQFIEQRLGLSELETRRFIVPSPFGYAEKVRLMVPTDLPLLQDVPQATYSEVIADAIIRIAEVTEGRMLVLFTSNEMLRQTHDATKVALPERFTLLSQGITQGSRQRLMKQFKQLDACILFGTASFWEGVDVPGDDLSCLVIVRLPFAPPDQPIVQARSEQIEQQGKSSFFEYSLPQAIIRFKQGFGRLIRTTNDRGVVFVFDRRIETTRYGKRFVSSLPQVPVLAKPLDELTAELELFLNDID
ncbi:MULTISPECIES: ATP-dependent DNA helicase DinG [Exiguobacterium]|uniref:3'-5' exonuclease DinG n=1 Tax=Exiguobacterium antarcticum TaxID=132920 RepID=A0ABT6QZH8_9BACL|nr:MULTISPECIES: ATP-dependent DNA helicase DinG [Exiguobacterium]AFS70736.1 ATP-dependent helicase dinG [Exiguobacterium antarcticum B7]MCT4779316.1 ATP-dependent DNA helicase DinG [Exiguobacterium soli]MDI3233952.1 ATP-dependent DNA helicase DinG [Exiguobacterium antarcticum]